MLKLYVGYQIVMQKLISMTSKYDFYQCAILVKKNYMQSKSYFMSSALSLRIFFTSGLRSWKEIGSQA